MSGLMGVLAHTYFPSMLVATGTITIEFTVANVTNACVCARPHGEVTVNANPTYYYEGQQQMLHTSMERTSRHV
jgi:hypothetical protein